MPPQETADVAAPPRPVPFRPPTARRSTPHPSLAERYGPGLGLAIATIAFIAISVWWLSENTSLPDGDSGRHMLFALNYFQGFRDGEPGAFFLNYNVYPPLVHVVGTLGAAVAGFSPLSTILANNLVFVPLLALGCYKAGEVAFDRRVGALAGIFALAAPMVISIFHVFMLDGPQAAMVAVSVWLLLASRRFADLRYTLLAAVAVGLGFYTKNTFVLFVAGMVLVMLIRGGWREWRNFVAFSALALLIVQPWYLLHFDELRGVTAGNLSDFRPIWYGTVPYPERWSVENFTWYGWNLVNNQLYLPLTLFLGVGLVWALASYARRPSKANPVPELVAGGLLGYVAISLLHLDDPRYSLPILVFVALLGTAWIVRAPRVLGLAAALVLVGLLLLNTLATNFGWAPTATIRLPSAVDSPIKQRTLVVSSTSGFFANQPSGFLASFKPLLERARADGARKLVLDQSVNTGVSYNGIVVFAAEAGLDVPSGSNADALGPQDVLMVRKPVAEVGRPPCIPVLAPMGIYLYKGRPSETNNEVYCPPPLKGELG